jgi:hypothetical protein
MDNSINQFPCSECLDGAADMPLLNELDNVATLRRPRVLDTALPDVQSHCRFWLRFQSHRSPQMPREAMQ